MYILLDSSWPTQFWMAVNNIHLKFGRENLDYDKNLSLL